MEGATNLVSSALADVMTIFSQASSMVTSNAVAMSFVGLSLASGGLGLFFKVVRRH